jgi:hypothetical protein
MVQCDTTADNAQFIEEVSQRCAPAPASHRHRVKPSARTFSGRSGLPFPSDYFVSSQFPIVGWLSAWMHSRVSASKSNVRTAGRWGAVRPRRCPAVSPSLGQQGFAASVLRSEVVRAEGDSVAQRVARRALSDSIAAPPGEYALLVWNNELAALAAARRVDPDRVVGLDRGGGEVRLERPAEHPAVFYRGHPVDRVLFRSRDEAREPHSSCLQEPIGLGALPGKQSQQLLVPLDAEPAACAPPMSLIPALAGAVSMVGAEDVQFRHPTSLLLVLGRKHAGATVRYSSLNQTELEFRLVERSFWRDSVGLR